MDKYDASQLTEFPRYEPESTQSGVSIFFNKLWKFPMFTPSESSENLPDKDPTTIKQNAPMSDEQKKQDSDDSKTETGSYAVEFEGRSLPNVLRRISSLIALGSGGQGTRYADTELARYWMPDDISRECYECALRFSTLRRRHHCRVCGQIFCSRCCSQRVPGQIFGCAGGLRVCNYCCNVVLSYLKENDMTGEISPDLRTLQENLQVKFPENRSSSIKSRDNFMFAREQEERSEARPTPTEALLDLYRQLVGALPQQQHRYRLVRYNGVWRGCDILQWVMDNTNYKTRFQASQVCQNLLSSGYMECVSELLQFADYALYRPSALPALSQHDPSPRESLAEEGGRLLESVSSYCLDLNLGNSSARLIKAPKQETRPSPPGEDDPNPVIEQNEGYAEPKKVCRALLEAGEDHLRLLLRQCLAREALPASWLPVLSTLCHQAADIIMTDMFSSDIDVRNYVQVKKVPGDSMSDSCVLQGVVLTKNVAHRGMPQQITNPTILLLDCSIAYQRVEGKLTSLEPVLLQEEQYLVRCAARIAALQPRVVLVRGGAARAVQDSLREAGVALAVRLGERALARAARCTRADLVASIDARIGTPRLGTADKFYVKNYSNKTLMVLEGCAEPKLGCCILLRGASLQELARVKKVAKFMLLACYNWKLERAFLGDIEAILPEPGMTFEDDCEVKDPGTLLKANQSEREETDGIDTVMSNEDWEATIVASKNKESSLPDSTNSTETKNLTESNTKISEPDDPLQRTKPFRKTDSEKNFSCGVPIRDFSDPLRATLDDDVFLPKEEAKLKADNHTERWCIDDVVLSMSPITIIPAPYLETEAGRKCPLREYFPQPLLKVPNKAPHTPRQQHRKISKPQQNEIELKDVHPFIREPVTAWADDVRMRAALAHYRATGGRYRPDKHKHECPLYKPCVVKKSQKEPPSEAEKITEDQADPFAPEQHQRLSMLIYSYCSKSANVPDFCVNPWIVTMELYGKHDISLGAFLEKYCFNPDYKCPSTSCQVPMNQHVRRFVHGDVCLTITCNTVGHSNVDKIKEDQNKQVMFWSRCEVCGASGRARALSGAALSWSLGAYLRARVLGGRALRAPACPHALPAHAHAFARRLTTACVRYSKISTFDIKLPPKVIATNYDTKKMREALIQQLNDLMLKGHETFSGLTDSEAEKDQQNFKQLTDLILCALTSTNLQEHTTLAGVVRSLWNVSDRIISGEKMLRDAQDKWAAPQRHNNKPHVETAVEEKSDLEDSTGESANESSGTTYVFSSDNASKEITGTEEDEEKGDKKTVRQILSQLLSNNQPANQVGIIISSGVLPVVVCAGDIGSVIAATLASITYQRTMKQQRQSTQTEPDEAESVSAKDKTDGDKSKAAKSNDHIEVLLKDGLLCRVYYAPQFQKLRHMLLAPISTNQNITDEFLTTSHDHSVSVDHKCCCDDKDKTDGKSLCEIEEGFIRSLAHCVPWAARGGKSGSTFCKTKDDRYVLKEMTKPEWQQFLEFAPHYFNYVTNCHQNNQPSLLARIVGVYSVGGAGNGILVMENVWYACAPRAHRFDLKGSCRHRLAHDTPVLMDENLLHLRWESPLYVLWHAGAVVWSCIERDTDFLASHAVMDYSLLLGIDGDTLVLGLIDYIRTFTWDKKLEHLVKKNLGSGQPTVVSPDQYKRRFCGAARKYFLQCPRHWDHLYHIRDA